MARLAGFGIAAGIFFYIFTLSASAQECTGAAWCESAQSFRREVILPADPDTARDHAPILLDLTRFGDPVDLDSIRVVEVTGGAMTPIDAAAYAEETGDGPRLYFTAPGTTPKSAQRVFHVYYNKCASWNPYTYDWRSGASFGGSCEIDQEGSKFYYYLRSQRMEFKRSARNKLPTDDWDPQRGAFYDSNPDGTDYTHFTDLDSGFSPLDGTRIYYAVQHPMATDAVYFNDSGEERSFNYMRFDRNGPTAAMAVQYDVEQETPHKYYLSHRMFKDLPLLETTQTLRDISGQPLCFAGDYFHARQFYWKDSFDPARIHTDLYGDESLHSDSEVKHWQILYEDADEAIGVFTFEPSEKQHYSSQRLMDYRQLSAQDGNTLRVYYAVGERDEILSIFRTFKRGYSLGDEQQRSFDILQPAEGAHFVRGEAISVIVDGEAIPGDLRLDVQRPGAGTQTLAPSGPAGCGSPTAVRFDLGTVGASAPFGKWVLSARGGGEERTAAIDVNAMAHPRAIFSAEELAVMRQRWACDARFDQMKADFVSESTDAYAEGCGTMRSYGRRMLTCATALMMSPGESGLRANMWNDFSAILDWKLWCPYEDEGEAVDRDDVAYAEVLVCLALVFDWHQGDLDAPTRRLYAEELYDAADTLLKMGLAEAFPARWNNYNWIHNNRSVMEGAALALVDRAIGPYVREERRAHWHQRLDSNWNSLMETLPNEGSDNESYSYAQKTDMALYLWCEARRLNGQDAYSHPWFNHVSTYDLFAMIPGQGMNLAAALPFGNSHEAPYECQQMTAGLIAARKNDGVAQWIALNTEHDPLREMQPFWIDFSRPASDVAQLPNWHYFPRRGLFVFRSSWDTDAMYFAVKCGEYWGGHEHPDLGSFVLYRDGMPYIAPAHYLNGQRLEDENIVLINETGLASRSPSDPYCQPTAPEQWGRIDTALGSPDYFNVVADPSAAYEEGADLDSYKREFVGFDDIIFLREDIRTNSDATFRQVLHNYRTYPAGEESGRYDHYQYPGDMVMESAGSGRHRIYPNKAVYPSLFLTLTDRSNTPFSTQITDWRLIPHEVPGYLPSGAERAENSSNRTYQIGEQLERTASGRDHVTSLQAFDFAQQSMDGWDSGVAEDGMVVYGANPDTDARIKVVWPRGQTLDGGSAARGLEVNARMAMRHYARGLAGGRSMTLMRDHSAQGEGGATLIASDQPLDIVSSFASGGNEAWLTTHGPTRLELHAPAPSLKLFLNGRRIAFEQSGSQIIINLPHTTNAHLEMDNRAAARPSWTAYR